MWRRTTGRWRRALATLTVIERRSPALPSSSRWRHLEANGPAAYRLPLAPELPRGLVPVTAGETLRISAPVTADAVVIGKFDRGRQVRIRSFYVAQGLSARVQAGSRRPDAEHGVSRSVRAAHVVGRHRPQLMPEMVDHGSVFGGRTAYLVERTVVGQPPADPAEVVAVLPVVAAELAAVQRAEGVTTTPFSATVPPAFGDRWRGVVEDGHVPAALAAHVERIIARDELLEVGFTHGDLVTSNILRVDDRIVLIDWEYAGVGPIAFDLAKIHVNSGPAGPAVERLEETLDGLVGHGKGHYSLVEQLALAHVVVLSRLEVRMRRAQEARRLEPLRRQTVKRVKAVQELLALEP